MVISNSQSTNTLINVNHHLGGTTTTTTTNSCAKKAASISNGNVVKTDILLAALRNESESRTDCNNETSTLKKKRKKHHHHHDYYLKYIVNESIDKSLKSIPQVVNATNEFLDQLVVEFNANSEESILYVLQGEVAHATVNQCDILVSDRVTTCHIMAFYSTTTTEDAASSSTHMPLASLAHIDGTSYQSCIRRMVLHHVNYHHQKHYHHQKQKQKQHGHDDNDDTNNVDSSPRVELTVHLLGGFGSNLLSCQISNSIISTLAKIASSDELRGILQMTLDTTAISHLNTMTINDDDDDNNNAVDVPCGRGLGIHCLTGTVFLAHVDTTSLVIPGHALRGARLFADNQNDSSSSQLVCIHTEEHHEQQADMIHIMPFAYSPLPDGDELLDMSNEELVYATSTSPEAEDRDDYCGELRNIIQLMELVPDTMVFGKHRNYASCFVRKNKGSNKWVPAHPVKAD